VRLWGGIVGTALFATLLLVATLAALPDQAEVAADVYLIFLGGLALLGLVVVTGRSGDDPATSPFAAARRPRRRPPPPVLPELDRLGRELSLGTQSAFDFHVRLRPVLQEIAEARLAARGRRLEDAEGLLGPEAWELVRPDKPPPTNRHAPGADAAAVRRFVDALEKI
jgi:hypothetical protein